MINSTPRRRAPILCVDDDENLLEGLKRVLHPHFSVTMAVNGEVGLQILAQNGPFAVIVSDMRMPGMDGTEVLRRAKRIAPYTVSVLLTGQAELSDAVAAVNEGHLFRFMTKPCRPSTLIEGLTAAVEQYRLVISERILLERTLRGSIEALIEILSLSQPAAFGRAKRARNAILELAEKSGVGDRWVVEVAAMLSQIGCVTLPASTIAKIYDGDDLTEEERDMVARMPYAAAELLASIPRLEQVTEIVRLQQKQYDGGGAPRDRVSGEEIPWGARALKIFLDFDALESRGLTTPVALELMRARHGWYDPALLAMFASQLGGAPANLRCEELRLAHVKPGMVFLEDVRGPSGALLIARGQEVTPSLASRLSNLGADAMPTHLIKMIVHPS